MATEYTLDFDFNNITGFGYLLNKYPKELAEGLIQAFKIIGEHDTAKIRDDVNSNLKIKAKGLAKTFRFASASKDKIKGQISKVFLDLYSKWKGAEIFQKGGTISPKYAQSLIILLGAGRGPGGKRRWSDAQIRAMISANQIKIIKTPKGAVLIMEKGGGLLKSGAHRKGGRTDIVGILRRNVKERKRLHFYETIESQTAFMQSACELAVEETLIALSNKKVK